MTDLATIKSLDSYTDDEKLAYLVGLEEQNRLRFNVVGDLAAYRRVMKAVHFLRNPLLEAFRANEANTEEEQQAILRGYKTDNPMNADLDKDIS